MGSNPIGGTSVEGARSIRTGRLRRLRTTSSDHIVGPLVPPAGPLGPLAGPSGPLVSAHPPVHQQCPTCPLIFRLHDPLVTTLSRPCHGFVTAEVEKKPSKTVFVTTSRLRRGVLPPPPRPPSQPRVHPGVLDFGHFWSSLVIFGHFSPIENPQRFNPPVAVR